MIRSLKGKMILSYLAVALLTVLVVSVLIRFISGHSLMSLVVEEQTASMTQAVEAYYTTNQTLDGFFDDYVKNFRNDSPRSNGNLRDGAQPDGAQPGGPSRDNRRSLRGVIGVVDTSYRALTPILGHPVGEVVPQEQIKQKTAVQVDGQTIAYVLPDTNLEFQLSPEEQLFLERTTWAIGLAALAGVLAAVGTGFFLASRLLRPIRQLTQASQAMAHGDLNQQVPVTSKDELGQLTETFNQMSADLNRADQQRKRMTADITHDLSTPLQIISGYIEMLEEEDVTLTPQRIEIIKTELGHLRRLVGDLTTLTQVEAGGLEIQIEPVRPADLLARVYGVFQPIAERQGVTLAMDVPEATPLICVDVGRMVQVLKNLLENALRYTPKGGSIQLSAADGGSVGAGGRVQLRVQDSGAGIDAEDLLYVFDRFYRAEKAREGNSGKMGLGLAICKALVQAQGGTIAAESAGKGQGTTMIMTFEASK